MDEEIPRDVQLKYEGRWIAWDTEERRVLADGESLEAVGQATQAERVAGRLIWYHHVLPHGTILVGGIW
jgi:hypothetical protein